MNREARRFELSYLQTRESKNKWQASVGEACRRARLARVEARCEGLPTDLGRLSRHLGVISIREVPLAMKGRLLKEGMGFAVEVNSDLPQYERRFSVAHELAHIIVDGEELRRSSRLESNRLRGMHSSFKERLCDAVASELLVPRDWIKARFGEDEPRLESVLRGAMELQVDIETVAERVVECSPWQCRFLWWTRYRGYFRAVRSVPFLSDESLAFVRPENQRQTLLRQAGRGDVAIGREAILLRDEGPIGRFECIELEDSRIVSLVLLSEH